MDLREAFEKYKRFKIPSLSVICEKASQYSKTCLLIVVIFVVFLVLALQYVPHLQVAQFGITNPKDLAEMENNHRATLAQMLGGIAVGIGIYFAWGNLTTAREGQITERFTRAVDQLGVTDKDGNPAIEIRLGGIYALERIANESEKDFWPIMEILTAYVRENSYIGNKNKKVKTVKDPNVIPEDIQAILTVIGKHEYFYKVGDAKRLDFHETWLRRANLKGAHLEGAWLDDAYLVRASLNGAYLKDAYLEDAKLIFASLEGTHLERAFLKRTQFMGANLREAHFEGAYIYKAGFGNADLEGAHFEKTELIGVDLKGAKNLNVDQLSKVKTLYGTELDEKLEMPLREKCSVLFEEPDE